jgi:hypothetical protein
VELLLKIVNRYRVENILRCMFAEIVKHKLRFQPLLPFTPRRNCTGQPFKQCNRSEAMPCRSTLRYKYTVVTCVRPLSSSDNFGDSFKRTHFHASTPRAPEHFAKPQPQKLQ